VVAENLGLITPPVERLRHELGMPGTFVLQFAFTDDRVHAQPEPDEVDTVVYTGTHDNDTTVGWWSTASEREQARVRAALAGRRLRDTEPHWMLIRLALESRGVISIVPVQDVLGLDSRARLNVPGRAAGNWRWRLDEGQLDASLATRLRDATEAAGRC
jgi:4-alpha-glucanotransferase